MTSGILTELFFPISIKLCDFIFLQHSGQRQKQDQKYIVTGNIFVNNSIGIERSWNKKEYFCYVGSIDKRKGFDILVKLLNRNPHIKLKIIGGVRDKYSRDFIDTLQNDNIKILGKLSHDSVMKEISSSLALISTSPMEGFPNIFLEAWAVNVPVISLSIGLGGIIEKNNLGYFCESDFNLFEKTILNFNFPNNDRNKLSQYVYNHFSISSIGKQVKEILFI